MRRQTNASFQRAATLGWRVTHDTEPSMDDYLNFIKAKAKTGMGRKAHGSAVMTEG